eukprot:m.38623 g.38623  ORF g.38623 m.38623 type:complete len:51 (-) comp7859_c0_seq1:111-263(-)
MWDLGRSFCNLDLCLVIARHPRSVASISTWDAMAHPVLSVLAAMTVGAVA